MPNTSSFFQRFSISNTGLKIIAVLSMLTDHICTVCFADVPAGMFLIHSVGRMAMPLYAFLLTEGFLHTRNRRRYLGRLLIFALVSEPFFDFALHGQWVWWEHQNVLFTLALGLLMLCSLDALQKRDLEKGTVNAPFLMPFVIAGFLVLSWAARLDHEFAAPAMILLFYLLRLQNLPVRSLAACGAAALISTEAGCLLAVFPLLFYNEKRGPLGPVGKYFFYLIYPAHLLVLSIVRMLQ